MRLVGEAQSDATLRAFDGEVPIRKLPGSSLVSGNYYELVGEVNHDGSVTENFLYDWGTSFGMLIHLTHQLLSHAAPHLTHFISLSFLILLRSIPPTHSLNRFGGIQQHACRVSKIFK